MSIVITGCMTDTKPNGRMANKITAISAVKQRNVAVSRPPSVIEISHNFSPHFFQIPAPYLSANQNYCRWQNVRLYVTRDIFMPSSFPWYLSSSNKPPGELCPHAFLAATFHKVKARVSQRFAPPPRRPRARHCFMLTHTPDHI